MSLVARTTHTIKAGTAGTFSATEFDLGGISDFGVVLYVATGATATFAVEGGTTVDGVDTWVDISGGASLSGLTAPVRLDYFRGEFNGSKIRVACTSYAGTGNVAAGIDSTE